MSNKDISFYCMSKKDISFYCIYIRTYSSVQVQECTQFYMCLISTYLWKNIKISYKTIDISVCKKEDKPSLQ